MSESLSIPPEKPLPVVLDAPPQPPVIEDKEIREILMANGLHVLNTGSGNNFRALTRLGIYSDQIGLEQMQKGHLLLNQAQMRAILEEITARLTDPARDGEITTQEDFVALAKAHAYIVRVMNDTHKAVATHFRRDMGGDNQPRGKNKSLPPGVAIQINLAPNSDKPVDVQRTA